MNESYNLESILNAIEDIHSKPKKKLPINKVEQPEIVKNNYKTNDDVSPATEKIISEAEKYFKNFQNEVSEPTNFTEDVLILDKEYNEQNLDVINLEKINRDLNLKINDLKEKIEYLKIDSRVGDVNNKDDNKNNLPDKEHFINKNNFTANNINNLGINKESFVGEKESDLSEDIIKTLKDQNSLIKNFEKNEEKFLLKIVDLEQDITLLSNTKKNISQNTILANSDDDQKKLISKIESQLIFFRENYERLIIENNDVKKKLSNSKNQIVVFEENIKELQDAIVNLNNIMSKNSIIKLNDSHPKDSSVLVLSEENSETPKLSTIPSVFNKDNN
jgi:hypothetical protein